MREIEQQSIARPTREEIALALDGVEPAGEQGIAAGYRAARALLEPEMPERFSRLRRLGSSGLVSASSRFDDIHRLLLTLGIDAIPTSAIPEASHWPGIIVVGCQQSGDARQHRWFERMLARGAIVVTSDCTATVPIIASRLKLVRKRPVRRGRIAPATGRSWRPLPADYVPAVRLAPGHQPLARQHHSVTVLATDALTTTPLVVLAAAGGGQVLHSVAHWWQDADPDTSEVGTRRLADVPAFAELGRRFPEACFGTFGAALALVTSLMCGLDLALDRAGVVQPVSLRSAIDEHEGESLGTTA